VAATFFQAMWQIRMVDFSASSAALENWLKASNLTLFTAEEVSC
jgi:hypothetical protein